MTMINFKQSKNIRDYKTLISGLHADFGDNFYEAIKCWCKENEDDEFWEVWLVKNDNKTIGICGLYSLEAGTKNLWLGWLGILSKYRNNGIGKELMQFLYAEANKVGCKHMYSYVDYKGKPLSFYHREGFKQLGSVREFLNTTKMKNIDKEMFEDMRDHVIVKKL